MNKEAMIRAFFAKPTPKCDCRICWPEAQGFVLCPSCGSKRCPKATYHRHACTRSNESGQVGSVYGLTRCGPKSGVGIGTEGWHDSMICTTCMGVCVADLEEGQVA